MQLEPFALERFQSIWENRVPFNVAESGVHPLNVADLVEGTGAREALLRQSLGYPQTNGTLELRQAIANLYPSATPDNVQVTNGGSEANCILLMRLVEPGDNVVVMTPNYMQTIGLSRALGAEVRAWPLREESTEGATRWMADVDELRRLVTPRTRVMLLCNPNNPTAARFDGRMLEDVCRIAERVGAWVISDEIYRGAEREADDTPSVWGRYERALVSSGLSKAYGLPGLRIGWIVGASSLVDEAWAVHDYTSIAPGAINDLLARIALEPTRRAWLLDRTRRIIRANYPIVADWIGTHDGLSHAAPEAGAIVFVRYDHPIASIDLATRLRDERGVLIVPGSHFDKEGFIRIGFGADPAHLTRALEITGDFMDSVLSHAR
jgi:aspartate/methionine/tyrosine aminotransferase